jgi:hypothetical protein
MARDYIFVRGYEKFLSGHPHGPLLHGCTGTLTLAYFFLPFG